MPFQIRHWHMVHEARAQFSGAVDVPERGLVEAFKSDFESLLRSRNSGSTLIALTLSDLLRSRQE